MRRTHADNENVFDCGRGHEEQVDEIGGSSWREGSAVRRREKGNPLTPFALLLLYSPPPTLDCPARFSAQQR